MRLKKHVLKKNTLFVKTFAILQKLVCKNYKQKKSKFLFKVLFLFTKKFTLRVPSYNRSPTNLEH